MRLGLKAALVLFLGYAILMGSVALGVNNWMRSLEETAGGVAASLVAREKTGLLTTQEVRAVATGDAAALARLKKRVQTIMGSSGVVTSLTIVDGNGKVVAGPGTRAARPSEVFGGKRETRAEPLGTASFLEGAPYAVYVPLEQGDELIGYAQAVVQADDAAGLYGGARKRLLAIALLGLVGVALLGLLLQYQIARRAASITDALEETPSAAPLLGRSDEFTRTLAAATRVREALNEARKETGRLHHGFSALAQVMKVGVVMLTREHAVAFANPRALELLRVPDVDGVRHLFESSAQDLAPLFAEMEKQAPGSSSNLSVPLHGGGRDLRVESYRMGDAEGTSILLLNDPQLFETLEVDVRLASQLEGVARTYRTVAHELRAPLSAVMINLDLLRESLGDADSGDDVVRESRKRYVSILGDEFARLNRSLAELLTKTAPPNQPPKPLDICGLVRDLGTLLAPQARRQGVRLHLQVPEAPISVNGYRDRLKQALLNICVNALEAMPEGGDMTIDVAKRNGVAGISVQDTGAGIEPELLPRIYESDFTTKGGGNGIGLHVARALVELHGGRIEVQSRVGEGARVDVNLPVATGG
jgi:signal transduction histidine kinase